MKRFTLYMIVFYLVVGCSGPGKDPDQGGGQAWPDMGTGHDDDLGVGAYDVGNGPVDTYYLDCPPDKTGGGGGGGYCPKPDMCIPKWCGDGVINPYEQCDGSNLQGKTCQELGYDGGTLACKINCTYDTSGCFKCGNNKVEGVEECDGKAFGGNTCKKLGFAGGTLKCKSDCTIDKTTCTLCGNNKQDGAELCDGVDLGGKTCTSLGFAWGSLACTNGCFFDTSGCKNNQCGDGKVWGVEECDGKNLNGKTCATLGYGQGTLACNGNCTYDLAGCHKCGDGKLNGKEQCEGADLGGKTCKGLGYAGGALKCTKKCALDATGCTTCGDSKIDKGEQCDGNNLGGATCKSKKFDYGTLACKACKYDLTGCGLLKCGDGKISGMEQCDGANLNGKSCKKLGFKGGTLKCQKNCMLDASGCTICGDGKIDNGEQCDKAALGGKTCASFKYDYGTLACKNNCTYDLAGCAKHKCGDGSVTGGEQCDGVNLAGKTCKALGYTAGTLACNTNCTLDKSGCTKCGDGKVAGYEQCEGNYLQGKTCKSLGYYGGTLKCSKSCTLDKSNCTNCGNSALNSGEQCDGGNLGGKTCKSLGYKGGTLSCYSTCKLNKSACTYCGDKKIQTGEQCDSSNLNGWTCNKLGYHGGKLSCTKYCTLNKGDCTDCGNGVINGGEQCDTSQLGGKTCVSIGYKGGTLSCYSTCVYNKTGCHRCGDGQLQTGEQCDRHNLGGKSCKALGYTGGALKCASNCTFNKGGCTTCGNGKLESGEKCDGAALGGKSCKALGFAGGTLKCGVGCAFDTTGCYQIKTLKDDTFTDFSKGALSEAGAKIYASAKGNVQLLDRLDLNQDGHNDLVFGNSFDGSITKLHSYIYWGATSGYTNKKRSGLPTMGARGAAAADLNGDGHMDLIFANHREVNTQGNSYVYKTYKVNSYVYWGFKTAGSTTGYSASNRVELPSPGGTGASVADLNADGHLDIVITSAHDGTTHKINSHVYWGSATGLSGANRTALPTLGAAGSAIADLNGDGRLDVVIANSGDGKTAKVDSYIYWGQASGFSTANRTSLSGLGASAVSVADLNGDGLLDVVLANRGAGLLTNADSYIYWGSTAGFAAAKPTGLPTVGATGSAVADLDKDGHLDIVFSNGGIINAKSYIYWGSSAGFSTKSRTELPTSGAGGILAADLNKDGYRDVVFANLTNGPVWAVKSDIYWGGAAGFSSSNKTGLPTIGARSVFGGEPGAASDRGAKHAFTSRAMDTGLAAPTYMTLAFTATTPKGTTLRLQVRSASTLAGLESAKWGAYYTAGGAINAAHNGNRYMQYRAELTSDFGNTPVLDKVEIKFH